MAMDLNVYNYLMTGYNTKPAASKYGAHKTSELRSIVRDIAKRTKSSPIYLVKLSDDKQAYALNVKESSIALHDAFEDLMTEDDSSVFGGRKAVSSQAGDVSVNIDTEDYEKLPSPFSMEVHGLAKQQVNVSKEFYDSSRSLEEGLYRFRIRVNDDSYDFQYNIPNIFLLNRPFYYPIESNCFKEYLRPRYSYFPFSSLNGIEISCCSRFSKIPEDATAHKNFLPRLGYFS